MFRVIKVNYRENSEREMKENVPEFCGLFMSDSEGKPIFSRFFILVGAIEERDFWEVRRAGFVNHSRCP